ncbi:MCE family protein [Nocardia noduli]|uniref:MCE family protein n=1 Tax=Nocardia noduli TaxID=2815722 RepID=UPI0027DF929B|nr:MCE family protein [Nocardia noduli]
MSGKRSSMSWRRSTFLLSLCATMSAAGCGWQGVESLPLPGADGRDGDATKVTVEMANVGTLVSNSPVLVDDVVVGSVAAIRVAGWHAEVDVSIRGDAPVPANVVATVGQTSLLGSSHLALNTPAGAAPAGRLESGARIPLNDSFTYPSTEQTLASLSVVVNGGGLGQLGDIIANLNDAFDGRQEQVATLITRLDTFIGTLDAQRDRVIGSLRALDQLSAIFADQRDVTTDALRRLPSALDVLLQQRPNLTAALDRLRAFSDTATSAVDEVKDDLLTNLRNLEPTLKAVADVGPKLDMALAYATTFPYDQKTIDRAVQGDYINLFATVDLTVPRMRREILLGTPWADPTAVVQAAVGDPGYARQTRNPLGVGIEPSPSPPVNGGR